jgi:hypothetical protein
METNWGGGGVIGSLIFNLDIRKKRGQHHASATLSLAKEPSLDGPVWLVSIDEMFAPAGNWAPASRPVPTDSIDGVF